MFRSNNGVCFVLAASGLLLSACSGSQEDGSDDSGSIQLSLTNAPNDVSCLRVTIESARNTTKLIDMMPGMSTADFLIQRLPTGRAVVDGEAFPVSCDELDAFDGDPSFVSEAPVPVRIDARRVTSVALKLIRNAGLRVGVDFEESPSPYLVPSQAGVVFKDIMTVGDSIDGYRMAGIPDGLGAFDNGDGTFSLLMNHEFGSSNGLPRAHGATGAFVSKWTVRTSDLTVLSGEDLIQKVMLWDADASSYVEGEAVAFNRFCSADLPAQAAFYDEESGLGYDGRLFTSGEESGTSGRAFAHALDGTSYELPRLGNLSFENVVANPGMGAQTMVAAMDDTTPGQLYFYIGNKTSSGSPVDKAGLTNGTLLGLKVGSLKTEPKDGIAAGAEFTLVDLGNVENASGGELEASSISAGVTAFNRPEDGAWDPRNPNVFYFVTTASFSGPSRLFRLTFSDLQHPDAGGTIDMLLDGSEGQKMLDNITVDKNGHVMLQEDVGNNVRLGKVWRYDVATDELIEVGQHDPQRFLKGGVSFLTKDEESSGLIDMTDILGPGWFLLDVQAHYGTDAETVQGGQLVAMYDPSWLDTSAEKVSLAIIGDTPYGAAQLDDFSNLIGEINGAPKINTVVHVGDTKSGSTRCDDSYYEQVLAGFQSFADPVIYAPGDNEWTDCHRANNGAYDPVERLDTVRSLFFPVPGRTLGAVKKTVLSQSSLSGFETFAENTLWSQAQVTFAALHVVGSNNSLLPWYTDDRTGTKQDDPERRRAEKAAREAAGLDWLDRTFDFAEAQDSKGVALFFHADMWDAEVFDSGHWDGFIATVQRLAERARAFGKPVLLVNGDSHKFVVDQPLAEGDEHYGVSEPVPNLTRVIVQGSTTKPLSEWLRLEVDPTTEAVFSWVRNPR